LHCGDKQVLPKSTAVIVIVGYINKVLLNTNTMDINIAKTKVSEVGFLDINIDPSLDLFQSIQDLKSKKNAIVLAHY
jgi:hypothetical protein